MISLSLIRFFSVLLVSASLPAAESGILIKDGQTVAFLGDSITAAGWEPGGYVRLVVDGLAQCGIKVKPVPAGISQHKSNDMLARLDRDVLSKKPDWMTLSCGVNDVWHGPNGVALESYKTNITAILDQAEAKNVRVIVLTSTPIKEDDNEYNQKLVTYNEFLRQIAAARGLPLADLSADFQAILKPLKPTRDSRYLTVDGAHMHAEGNVVMAKGCLRAMGVSAAQMERIEQAWMDLPNNVPVPAYIDLRANYVSICECRIPLPASMISLRQFRGLEALAKTRKTEVTKLCALLWLRAMTDVMKEQTGDGPLDVESVMKEARLRLPKVIAAEVGPASVPATPAAAAVR